MQFGDLDLSGLAHEADKINLPEVVKGRTVHIDGDFLAYQMSAEKADGTDTKTWEDMKHNCEVAAHTLKSLAGAEFMHIHLTPGTSDKGDRHALAIQKQYQGNRIDKPKPRYLHIMREWMGTKFPATMHQRCEADDGMASAQYAALTKGDRNLSIIASKDKDLQMVPGLHVDWDTGEITDSLSDFGEVSLFRSKTITKIKGYGQKFFWAQMLTGDTADNIQGLPKIMGAVLNAVSPTAAVSKALAILGDNAAPAAKKQKAQQVLDERPFGQCGPVIAAEMLQRISSNKQAFSFVKSLYEGYGQAIGFRHWETGDEVPWQKVFVSEAQLLWMRREKHDPLCVGRWFKEILQ